MKQFEKDYIKNYSSREHNIDIDFSDKAFAYDYNEVQELFFCEENNNFVFLVGESKLRKKEMLGRICQDLFERGVAKEDCLYLDFELPILRDGKDIFGLIDDLNCRKSEKSYLIINEITIIKDWFQFILKLKSDYPHIQLLSASTVSYEMYEKIYSENLDYCKIIVLSKKIESNIKYETEGFGVYKEFKYNIKNGIVEIKGLTKIGKLMNSHIVPDEIDGFPVKVIASGAFHDRSEINEIFIPSGVEQIGDYAFAKCSNLVSINLPSALQYIGENAFLGAINLENITGGEFIEHIGCSAFFKTKWLEQFYGDFVRLGTVLYRYIGKQSTVTVPSGIDTIASFCFAESNILQVDLNNVEIIEEGAFYECTNLKSVINLNCAEIGALTFYGNKELDIELCHLKRIGNFAFANCACLKSVNCDAATIGACAFENCYNLNVINGDINDIDIGAFYYCRNLTRIELSLTKKIAAFALAGSGLEKCILPVVQRVGDYAFMSCDNMEKIDLTNAKDIGFSTLLNCNQIILMSISGRYKMKYYFGGIIANVKELFVVGDVVDDFNRGDNSLERLHLSNVKKFGRWSFYGNSKLSNIVLNGVDCIGDWAFAYCDNLTNIDLPQSVKSIGMNGFRYCHNLNNIIIRCDNMISAGVNAFYATSENKKIQVEESLLQKYKASAFWKEYAKDMFKI